MSFRPKPSKKSFGPRTRAASGRPGGPAGGAAARGSGRDLTRAWAPIIEGLESRRLFSATTVQPLPFALDFSSAVGNDVLDKDNQSTGFTRIQANKNGNEYQKSLIDLDTAAGVLKITTSGNSTVGSNYESGNTLINGLETQFDGTTSGWKVTARLIGPLGFINNPSEQGGIMFGPDQDNYIKLVAVSQPNGQFIQFTDEQSNGTGYVHSVNTFQSVGSFSSINTLDLQLVGNAANGTVRAYYNINGTGFVEVGNQAVTLTGAKKSAFFNATSRAGLIALHKNDVGPITVTFDRFAIEPGTAVSAQPQVTTSRPANGQIDVPRDGFVAADVFLPTPGANIDGATLNGSTVKLYRTSDLAPIDAVLNTSGGGDAIVLTPTVALEKGTKYTFEVTSGLQDTSGAPFQPYTATFTTDNKDLPINSTLAFEKIALPTATGHQYTAVTVRGGKLYAATLDGVIHRFDIAASGALSTPFEIKTVQAKEGGPRMIIGLAFDAAGNLWVSHNQFTDINTNEAADWTGMISKLSGTDYTGYQRVVSNLPRSVRDHMTNQLAFGPDGALYFSQGANTAMGAPDNAWGLRGERLLNSAILRLDVTKVGAGTLDAKTKGDGGTYDPFAAGAALTLYATGVRNAYDLVWTSKDKLFAPTNGSAAGGTTPSTPPPPYSIQRIDGTYTSPNVQGSANVQQTQSDYVFNIVPGGYYGQPNPRRGEFVLNGGNPNSGIDPNEVTSYPVGTQPDRNYRGNITGAAAGTQGSAYRLGLNYSPNGIIEYQSGEFGGLLQGRLLVAEYSGGDDIAILTPDANGNITQVTRGVAGLTHFVDPLDIAEDPATGNLYVSEFGASKLTLVRPITPGAALTTDKQQIAFNDITGNTTGRTATLKITNTGTSSLTFPSNGFTITGDTAKFKITQAPPANTVVAPGASVDVTITFTATTVDQMSTAMLVLQSNDPNNKVVNIPLRGLGTSGTGSTNEPSLQQIMNLYGIPINVGDTSPNDTFIDNPPAMPNDEVVIQSFVKAGGGPVTIEPLAVFGVGNADNKTATFRFGHYTSGNRSDVTELFASIGQVNGNDQTVNPVVVGETSFDPGAESFGLYTWWENFTGATIKRPTLYQEDAFNTAYDAKSPRKLRFYKLEDAGGNVVPNAYVFGWEEFTSAYDQQDFVGIIRNVKPANAAAGPEIGLENLDSGVFTGRMVFNRIQKPGNVDPKPDNITHDTGTLRIWNTGTTALSISSVTATSGWTVSNVPTSIAAGKFADVTVQFVANPGVTSGMREYTGTLTINSSDADEPVSTVSLHGNWKWENENNVEPSLQQIVSGFGFSTVIAHSGQSVDGDGKYERVGEEVLSSYWFRANTSLPVTIRQIAAWHGQGDTPDTKWFLKSSTTNKPTIFEHDADEGQSYLPHLNNGVTGINGKVGTVDLTKPAIGTFTPASGSNPAFGFAVDGETSDRNLNGKPSAVDQGHHVRFWVARDQKGNIIANTYLMAMDYSGINYDYQDNVYLISNVRPESGPGVPNGVVASASGAGNAINWNDSNEGNHKGYNVYRATSAGGAYTKLNSALLTSSDFLDVTAPVGAKAYYVVTAVDNAGNESARSAEVSATRTNDSGAPANPAGLAAVASVSGIALNWNNNGEADLKGYNVYRSTTAGGPWTKLNAAPFVNSDYVDGSAPAGVASFYKVTAVDTSSNESSGSFVNATRPSNDTTAPAKPTIVSTTPASTGIAIDWSNNGESDLAGYNVYRSADGSTGWVKLNGSLLIDSFFNDPGAPAGSISYYRVSAVDNSSNESAFATTSATRPADTTAPQQPVGLTFVASSAGIALDWSNNTTDPDLAGFNVYRSANGVDGWMKLNTTGLISNSSYNDAAAPAGQPSHYRVTAVDASGNESSPATGSATRPNVDATFAHADIGSPAPAGSLSPVAPPKDYDLLAGGADIFGNADSFGFAYREVSGDFDYKVRLNGLTNTHSFAKAGLMARESLASNSRNVMVAATPGANGHRFTYRGSTGGSTTSTGAGAVSYPNNWLRLARVGNVLTGYRSTNGTDWTVVGSTTVTLGANVLLGMALTSHDTTKLATAQFRDLADLKAPADTAPGAPTNLIGTGSQSGIALDWDDNPESDLKQYKVYRSDAIDGTFTHIATVNGSSYDDASAPAGQTSYYRVTAVDQANQESTAHASTSATRPAADLPPATPQNLIATGSESGIALDWDNNTDADLKGYNVYRSPNGSTGWTLLNTGGVLSESAYNDAAAPAGQTSYYRVVAVDVLNQESASPATANAVRPSVPDNTAPAQPQSVVATGSTSGIALTWSANGENDLAGYDVFRSSNGVDGWTKLTTLGPINATSYNDSDAPAGATSFYQVVAVDTSGNASTPATAQADRPNSGGGPAISVNFQLNSSPLVAGYEQDNGDLYGARGNGLTYGWNKSHTGDDRDRNRIGDQLLDTLVQMQSNSTWTIDVANGTYEVKVSVGDSQYSSTNTLSVNGVSYWTGQALGINQFANKTMTVTVSNGKLVVSNAGAGDRQTKLNYIVITPTGATPTKPATPTNLVATGTGGGIQLDWSDNAEAGVTYDVFRSSAVDGAFTKVNATALSASAFLDDTAPVGATSFYRVVAINAGGTSDPATASAFRPAPLPTVKVNFQLDGSPLVAGYEQDNGDLYGARAGGLTFGWNKSHTGDDRDRNKNANQLLDTLVQMQGNSTWTIDLPNGTYTVKVGVGDSQYGSTNTLSVNGQSLFAGVALGINQFQSQTRTVTVTDGKLTLNNAGAADRQTKLNFIEIAPA
ncbi:MAG TPA: Ig-like domain-containing protein [Tepidisphaeraceae bacterium]|nr:Ig-like domain-containing protein [Tepidisphaeraceae bacterium]